MKYGIWFGRGDYIFRGRQCAVIRHASTRSLRDWVKEDPTNRIVVKRTVNVIDGARNICVHAAAVSLTEARIAQPHMDVEFTVARMAA